MKRNIFICLSLLFLISSNLFAQCDDCEDIEREYDSFDERYITTVNAGKLAGGNTMLYMNAILSLVQYSSKTDTSYLINLILTYPSGLTFINGEHSLVLKCDSEKISFQTLSSKSVIGQHFNIYTLSFKLNLETFVKIINSKEVKLRIYSSSGYIDRDWSFDEDNFSCFKCFYNNYISKGKK